MREPKSSWLWDWVNAQADARRRASGEQGACNRYFGTVTEALELDTAKNGYILLVQDAEPNFDVNGNSPGTPDSWISCSERMPKGYADVLVTDGEHVEVKWWDESGYWNSWTELNSDILAHEITHWMPLPEPPQEVNRG